MKHRFKQIHKTCSMLNLQTSPLCALWKIASTGFQCYYGNLNHLNIICFNIILRLKRHSAIFYTSKSVQCHSPCENTCKMSGRSFLNLRKITLIMSQWCHRGYFSSGSETRNLEQRLLWVFLFNTVSTFSLIILRYFYWSNIFKAGLWRSIFTL